MKMAIQKMVSAILGSTVIIALILADGAISVAMACNYYASPNGGGNGSSPSSPFRISQFWAVARPGTILCLLDGEYTGSSSMIKPPRNLRGTSAGRITIKALNDGKVTIDGQHRNTPVHLDHNEYFVLEGFNAHSSNGSVINIASAHNNIVRRVAAWDAAEGNYSLVGIHGGENNLLEDVAAWGVARKIFSFSQGGNRTTVRRAWGRWEGLHAVGPKMTYSLAYNSYNVLIENSIGTWSGERMKETYTLIDVSTGAVKGTLTDYKVDQPYGIFAMDRLDGNKNANSKLLGSIAYVQARDRFGAGQAVLLHKIDSVEIANTVVYVEPGSFTGRKTYNLGTLKESAPQNLIARNLTGIGGAGAYIDSSWQRNNIVQGATVDSVPNIFNGQGNGARVCYRYKDGVLTNEPLWPWPMNRRIIEAMAQSGRSPVDVTATIEKMFGSIPGACKGGSNATGSSSSPSAAAPLPSAPTNLQANP
jgi:hypothetical protein